MNGITWVHIASGMLALLAGTVAFVVRKGGGLHVSAGIGFCVAMLVLGITASILSPLKSPPESPVGGIMVCYFIGTAWMTARRRNGTPGGFEKIAGAGVLVLAALIIWRGLELALAPPGQFQRPPGPGALLALGAICLLAGIGDVRFILRGTLSATQRISRHLWRMCFAFFIATGSFFLGQQDALPQALHRSPTLLVLAFAPFALMLFWLVRVRFPGSRAPQPRPSLSTGKSPMDLLRAFRSDPLRHEGVRPFNIWGLRLFYLLMLLFVTPSAWQVLLTHEGAWEPLSAIAWAVWATYPALALFGLFQPLRWLPLMFFTIGYKAIWMAFVAYPLWQAGTLEGSSAQPITESFLGLPLLALVVPWGYAWRTYVRGARSVPLRAPVGQHSMP